MLQAKKPFPRVLYCESCNTKYVFRSHRPDDHFACPYCKRPIVRKITRHCIVKNFSSEVTKLLTTTARKTSYERQND